MHRVRRAAADQGFKILECQYELGLLAYAAGDLPAARAAFTAASDTEARGGKGAMLELSRAYAALLGGDPAAAARQLGELLARLGPVDALPWWTQLSAGDAWIARAELARAAGRPADARTAGETARRILEPVVAVHDSPHYVRRLERARAATGSP